MDREHLKHHLHSSMGSDREILIEILIELKEINDKLSKKNDENTHGDKK